MTKVTNILQNSLEKDIAGYILEFLKEYLLN